MSKSTKVAAPAAPVAAAPEVLYVLGEKAQTVAGKENVTLQRPDKGLGRAWREAKYHDGNSRAKALRALANAHGDAPFTLRQAFATLAEHKKSDSLTAWTPTSRIKAFIKNEYFVLAK